MISHGYAGHWNDRGRIAMLLSMALTLLVAAYVIATDHVWTPAVPAIAVLLPLASKSRRSAIALQTAALVVVAFFAWIGMASVGLFFIPGAVAMAIAVVRTDAGADVTD